MQSMTGCGTSHLQLQDWEVTVDLKSVNHRFLDLNIRLPRNIAFLEPVIRAEISRVLRRGHVEVFLTLRNLNEASGRVMVDTALAASYYQAAQKIGEATGAGMDVNVDSLMRMEGVVTLEDAGMDQDAAADVTRQALQQALLQLTEMRRREGEQLAADLSFHLQQVEALKDSIAAYAPEVVKDYRQKLELRLQQLLTEGIEPQRLAQEVAIFADKCAIDEELARLQSHLLQMKQYLKEKGEIGKKMDFLIQEMNREANTIGSKASDARIAQLVVDLKSEIEKLREQIQNVE